MQTVSLEGAFEHPPTQAAQCFRAALNAMARPGSIHRIAGASPPAPLDCAAGALMLTFCDPETPVWLSPTLATEAIKGWLAFHCAAPLAPRGEARFVFGRWQELLPVDDFAIGTPEYPDRSATLVVLCDTLGGDHTLKGPGIQTEARLTVPDPVAFQRNAARYPLGWDAFLVVGDSLAAVPRTTRLEI